MRDPADFSSGIPGTGRLPVVSGPVMRGVGNDTASTPGPQLIDVYSTDFESFPIGPNQLGGRDGWLTTNNTAGLTGIVDFNGGRGGYVGFNSTTSNAVLAWRPININPVGVGTPVIQFNVDLVIADSTNGARDDFYFVVYNTQGQVLGGIDFYNVDQHVYRFDGTSFQNLGTFARNTVSDILISTGINLSPLGGTRAGGLSSGNRFRWR